MQQQLDKRKQRTTVARDEEKGLFGEQHVVKG
jgi:hypothetical protein